MIYFDHNATAPLRPEVVVAMIMAFGKVGNAASIHQAGRWARIAVERAREQIATWAGARSDSVVFVSGATEGNHLVIRGRSAFVSGGNFVSSSIEHPCVMAAMANIANQGATTLQWPVSKNGVTEVQPITDVTSMISLQAANHETGVLQPIEAAKSLANAAGTWLHVDAAQAAGKIPISCTGIDALVISAHKLGGPQGIGAVILASPDEILPIFGGGAQERGRRAGTVNVPAIIGFGEACRIITETRDQEAMAATELSRQLRAGLRHYGARIVGDGVACLPNTTLAIFPEIRGETLVQALDLAGFCVSSGAACASGSVEPSPVLLAMGDPSPEGGVRFSFGPSNTPTEVEQLLDILPRILASVRGIS